MPAVVLSPIPVVLDNLTCLGGEVDAVWDSADKAGDLREYLAEVPDPRHRRGVRHSLSSIVLIAACAVVAGACSFAAIVVLVALVLPESSPSRGDNGGISGPR